MTSSFGMAVDVGAWDDPDDHLGMAHFTEHILFSGSTEEPVPTAFQSYIAEHDGIVIATTDKEMTTYFSTLHTGLEALRGGLEKMSWFFTSPLFGPNEVAKEIQTIQNEYERRKGFGARYAPDMAHSALMGEDIKQSRFATGNKKHFKYDQTTGEYGTLEEVKILSRVDLQLVIKSTSSTTKLPGNM